MSNTLTLRVPAELAEWLADVAQRTGVPVSRIVREQLEKAMQQAEAQPFLSLAGAIDGPRDLSSRKGFSRK